MAAWSCSFTKQMPIISKATNLPIMLLTGSVLARIDYEADLTPGGRLAADLLLTAYRVKASYTACVLPYLVKTTGAIEYSHCHTVSITCHSVCTVNSLLFQLRSSQRQKKENRRPNHV
ncbi:hypothetical protein EI94DRAFT_930294 [Lactarius quietus]|nr:hypothetical protein EI94DRAFT_930294 [Lactarius quietus]